jgi:DNA-directed RNA polymerase, mitochondrial
VLRGRTWKPTIADGYEQKIREKKTKNAAAANLVHALDASHLVRTVNACVSNGITNIATIHDCFACLAPQVWGFTKLIRTEFVRMYTEHDPLAEVRERALRITSEVPDLPEYGAFDLRQVVQASYAFA